MKIATNKNMVYCRLKELIAQKERNEKRDITMGIVTKESGVSNVTLRKLANYNGINRIDASTIETLCNYFDCNVGDLLYCDRQGINSETEPEMTESPSENEA